LASPHDGGMPDAVVAVQVQVHGAAVVTPQHTGYRVWV